MKLAELIRRLNIVRDHHGDITVKIRLSQKVMLGMKHENGLIDLVFTDENGDVVIHGKKDNG